jgi:hypothetical protein
MKSMAVTGRSIEEDAIARNVLAGEGDKISTVIDVRPASHLECKIAQQFTTWRKHRRA